MSSLHTKENWGLFLLRFGLGVVFAVHGYAKLVGFSGTVDFLGQIEAFSGMSEPVLQGLAAAVLIVELVGGLALIVGAGSRLAASALAVVMVGAIVLVKGQQGFLGAAELDFALLFSLTAVVLLGSGDLRLRFASRGSSDKSSADTGRQALSSSSVDGSQSLDS